MRSPSTTTSARRGAAPVMSRTVAPRRTTVAASAPVEIRQAAARAATRNRRATRSSCPTPRKRRNRNRDDARGDRDLRVPPAHSLHGDARNCGLAQRHLGDLRDVKAPTTYGLLDLLATGEAVDDEERVGWPLPDRREELVLRDLHRHVVLLPLQAERSGHPAAARINDVRLHAEPFQDFLLLLESKDRLVVAMSVDEGAGPERRRVEVFLREELREGARLVGEPLRVLVVGKEAWQLVAEGGGARWLQDDDPGASRQLFAQRVEDLAQLPLRQIEHPVVVQGTAAAEALRLDDHGVAEMLENRDRRFRHLRVEEVVEGIRPEEDARPARVRLRLLRPPASARRRQSRLLRTGGLPVLEPFAKRFGGESRHLPLLRHPAEP